MTHNERVLSLLRDGKPHTHHELYALGVIAHSRVSDLRKRGYEIEQWKDGDSYLYRLSQGGAMSLPGEGGERPSDSGSSLAELVQFDIYADNDRWSRKA